jgi:hypothetical protein
VSIHSYNHLAGGGRKGEVEAFWGDSTGIVDELHLRMLRLNSLKDLPRPIRAAPVGNNDLNKGPRVVVQKYGVQAFFNEPDLISEGHDY